MKTVSSRTPLEIRILSFVREKTGVDQIELVSRRRQQYLVDARALFVWVARCSRPSLGNSELGRWLGERDPTTIMNLARIAAEHRRRNPEFLRWCDEWTAVDIASRETADG